MNPKYLLIVGVALQALGAAAAAPDVGSVSVRLEPSSKSEHGSTSLTFHLSYQSSEDLKIWSRSVIDSDDSSALIIVAREFPATFEPNGMACPNPQEVATLHEGPGQWRNVGRSYEAVADVDLGRRFNNLSGILRRCDLVVFWTYKPRLGPKMSVNRMSGSITVPAAGPVVSPPVVIEKIRKSTED
jgi:hypothetical protein